MHSLRKKVKVANISSYMFTLAVILQPRSDTSSEEMLGGCLTIQPIQNGNATDTTLPKLKSIKSENAPIKSTKPSVKKVPSNPSRLPPHAAEHNATLFYSNSNGHHLGPSAMQTAIPYNQTSRVTSQAPTLNVSHLPAYSTTGLPINTDLYTADPASPMQTAYPQMGANGFPMEHCPPMMVHAEDPIPSHPPPNYSQATATSLYAQLPPNYDSLMIGNEYP